MEKLIKQNIKLLAEKYKHQISYSKNDILLTSPLNQITIASSKKDLLKLKFNLKDNFDEIEIPPQEFYNCLIEIIKRRELEESIDFINGQLITIEAWLEEEGKYANERLLKLKKELKTKQIEYQNLGGNRYEVEYFKGILILIDDLRWSKSNVVNL